MKIFRELVKIGIGSFISDKGGKAMRGKFSRRGILISAIVFFVVFFCLFFVSSYALCRENLSLFLPFLNVVIIFLTVFPGAYFKVNFFMYENSDFEMLTAFPITHRILVFSRLTISWVIAAFCAIAVSLPISLGYVIYTKESPVFLLIWNFLAVTEAGFLVVMASALHLGVQVLVRKCENWMLRSAAVLGVPLVIMGGSLWGIYRIVVSGVLLTRNYLPAICGFAAITAVVLWLYTDIVEKEYPVIHSIMTKYHATERHRSDNLNRTCRKTYAAIMLKELRRVIAMDVCSMNVFGSLIFMLVLTVIFAAVGPGVLADNPELASLFFDRNGSLDSLGISMMFAIMMFVGSANLTSFSMSLEGKNMWILLSSPCRDWDVFKGKCLAGILIPTPFALISSVIVVLSIDVSLPIAVLIVLTPLFYCVFMSFFGMMVNLLFVDLSWNSPIEVVKFGKSSLIGILAGAFTPIVLSVIWRKFFSEKMFMCGVILCLIFSALSMFMIWWLKKRRMCDACEKTV